MKIFHQGLILVAVPLAIELVIVFTLIMHIHASQEAISELQKFTQLTRLMTATNGKIQEAFFQAGFMAIDKSDPSYEDALRGKVFDVEKSVMQIKKAFDEDARLSKYQTSIDKDWNEVRDTLLDFYKPKQTARSKDEKLMTVMLIQEKTASIRAVLEEALRDFYTLSDDAYKRTEESKFWMWTTLVIGVAINIIAGVALLVFYTKNISRRLGQITENSLYLVRGEPLLPVIHGTDEIAHLDNVFHIVAETLRDASNRERAVFENAVDVICSLDGDGRIMRINKAFFCFDWIRS